MASIAEVPLPQPLYEAHNLADLQLQSKEPSIDTTVLSTTPTQISSPTLRLVLDPSSITTDFDLLRFHAAAHAQLPQRGTSNINKNNLIPPPILSNFLISSPYNTPGHYLDLSAPSLPTPSLLLALALTALSPTTPSYATAPYTEALNFPVVINVLRDLVRDAGFNWPETSFYVVVFRSTLKEGIDQDWLYKLDFESHREACESGGLLKYWFGKADGERRNLATCFWHSRADAHEGGLGPWHVKARKAGRELYERIVFGTWSFVVEKGVREWRVEEWVE